MKDLVVESDYKSKVLDRLLLEEDMPGRGRCIMQLG